MFLGHYGLAFAAKKAAPKTSLGTLVFAAQFADLLWPILLLAGVEHVRIVPGLLPISPFDFTYFPFSHSLVAELAWGILWGLIYFAVKRDGRGALVVACLTPTHWVLDFIAHVPDMPIYPGGPKYGLGMWHSTPMTVAVEFILFAAGAAVYISATRAKDSTGKWAFWSFAGFLGIVYVASIFGPPPPTVKALAWSAMALWLTVPWASWADRHRQRPLQGRTQ